MISSQFQISRGSKYELIQNRVVIALQMKPSREHEMMAQKRYNYSLSNVFYRRTENGLVLLIQVIPLCPEYQISVDDFT